MVHILFDVVRDTYNIAMVHIIVSYYKGNAYGSSTNGWPPRNIREEIGFFLDSKLVCSEQKS